MENNQQASTELEKIYLKTINDLTRQVAQLTSNLSLAHAQIARMKEIDKERTEKAAKKK